jgi:type I restriction enzyme, S subunit
MPENLSIPKHWQLVRVGDYVISVKGKKPKKISPVKTLEFSIQYVNIKAFEKNVIDEYTDGVGCVLCEEGDFLMVWDGSRSGYVGKAIKGALGSTLVKLKFPNIDTNYAFYFLQSKYIEINTRAKGVGIPHVDPNLLWNYNLPIPPLQEQAAIVSKIEELLSDLENGKQQLLIAQNQLKVYRQSLLNTAFEGKPTQKNVKESELPKGWKFATLAEVCEMKAGFFVKADGIQNEYNEGLFPCYGGNGLRGYTKSYTHKGTFSLIGRQGALCGNVHRVNGIFHATEHAVVTTAKNGINTDWLFYKLTAMKLNQYSAGAAQPGLSVNKLMKIEIFYPPLNEQQLIVSELESKLTVCDKIEETISQSLLLAETLRQSILKKAFEGRPL